MCGRVAWWWNRRMRRLVAHVDERPLNDPHWQNVLERDRYNVPPTSTVPVIDGRPAQNGGRAALALAHWGFPIPRRPEGVFNTRIESATDSPLWRGLLGTSHCVFPVQGFYEWRRDGQRRTPFFIHRRDEEPLLLAGLIEDRTWKATTQTCASILTCPPNAFMADLHDRMPVILEADTLDAWLTADQDTASDLAVPAGGVLACHQVGTAVNDTKNDGPHLIGPIAQTGLDAFS